MSVKEAVVSGGKLLCPHCGSDKTAYGERLVEEYYDFLRADGERLVFRGDPQVQQMAQTQFVMCHRCGRNSALSAEWHLSFDTD